MSARKKRRRQEVEQDEDDEEEDPQMSQSQGMSQSQATGKLPPFLDMDKNDQDTIVGDVMRYILFQHTKKLPSKGLDIRKVIKKRCVPEEVLVEAKIRFSRVFGYRLLEVPLSEAKLKAAAKAKASKRSKKDATSDLWMLVTGATQKYAADPEGEEEKEEKQFNLIEESSRYVKDHAVRGVLGVVLALIQAYNGQMTERDMWHDLDKLYLSRKSVVKGATEPLQNLINNVFTKQLYLIKERVVEEGQEPTYVYTAGPRADLELPQSTLFSLVSRRYLQRDEVDQKALAHFSKQGAPSSVS